MARVLVVEDNQNLAEGLRTNLEFEGHQVELARDGTGGLIRARTRSHDLIVLDLMLPGMDGFRVLEGLRADGVATPVLVLTARGDEADKVRGLRGGADDYVTKPFSLEELTARIRAVLRRTAPGEQAPSRLTFADLELDEETHEVYRAGKRVQLSPTEFKLLRYLMLNANRVLSKAQILDHVWNYDFRGDDNIVESYISYLRRKIDTAEPRLIHTLRGVGYVLRRPAG